jgi:hypothetical protein
MQTLRNGGDNVNAIRLRTEYLKDPIGVDFKHPRLMWNVEGGKKQTAYQIVAENWDSGKVASSSMWAEYPKGLHDRERVNRKLRLWDENDEPVEWSEAFFERSISSWKAKWITGDYHVNKKQRYPVDCFRKAFPVDQPVEKARLYITACGLYEARLQGKRVGDFVMGPRLRYQESIDEILSECYDFSKVKPCIESKVFGIGVEAYTVASSEFALSYAAMHRDRCIPPTITRRSSSPTRSPRCWPSFRRSPCT